MRVVSEHEYTTYPRRFDTYRWYKPLAVGAIIAALYLPCAFVIEPVTKSIFGTAVSEGAGYDDMDFFTGAGAFSTCLEAVLPMLFLILAALIVRDRPFSSYCSSMGGWRWGVFFRTFAVGLVLVGLPTILWCFLQGNTGGVKFTAAGFIILTILGPLQGVTEELTFRGYLMQTVSSWFKLPAIGIIVQILVFAAVHPYNAIGIVNIAIAALMYALICVFTKGIEAGSALHMINNMATIYMAGFGFGSITADVTVSDVVFENAVKIAFFIFILIASKKLHWFDEVKYDDVAKFNAKHKRGARAKA